jgi:hypothetical protein
LVPCRNKLAHQGFSVCHVCPKIFTQSHKVRQYEYGKHQAEWGKKDKHQTSNRKRAWRKSSKREESVENPQNALRTRNETPMTARHVTEKEMQQTKGESAKEKRQVRSKKKHQIRAILGKRNGPISAVKRGKFDSAKAAKFRRQVVWGCKTLSLVPRFRARVYWSRQFRE